MNLWLYCHFPKLLMDTVCRIHAAAEQVPLAFYQATEPGHSGTKATKEPMLQCNEKAVAAGVERGQPRSLAQALVSELVCRPYNAEREELALRRLADRLYESIDKQVLFPPQGIAIAVDSLLRLYQGLEPLICHLEEQFQSLELTFSLAVGYSPAAARCLAKAGCEQYSADTADIRQTLGRLSVSQLGWQTKRVEKLMKSGIKTLHDLWQLPRVQLGKRFGAELVDDVIALQGTQLRAGNGAVTFYQPAEIFSLAFDLVTEIAHWQGVLFPLKRALKELESFLYQRQKVIRLLDIWLYHRDQPATHIPLKLAVDSWRASQFLQLIQLQVDRYPLKQPVTAISLKADNLYDLDRMSGHLISDGLQHQGDLSDLLARLQAKLGERALYTPAVMADPRPLINEYRQRAGAVTTLPHQTMKRPLWLLPQPEAVDIEQWQLLEGPERIYTGWWDNDTFERDYWIAEDHKGRLGWLFFQHQWYLQGWFS